MTIFIYIQEIFLTMPKSRPLSPELSVKIIDDIGQVRLSQMLGITPGAVSHWKKRGIPFYYVDFLIRHFPKINIQIGVLNE
jgi:hypothetical protein|nr:MAG TPA: hypothetical protein [Caudoviricetes sp.]